MSQNFNAPSRKPKEKIYFPLTDSSSGSIPVFNPPSFTHNNRRSVSSATQAAQRTSYASSSRDVRRRIRSVDLDPRNTANVAARARFGRINELESISNAANTNAGSFSDEYDLSHEDPQILQDVERALKLKARREARLKLGGTQSISAPSRRYGPDSVSPQTSPFSSPTRHANSRNTVESSPGKANHATLPGPASLPLLNLAPTSSDGKVLDWGGYSSEKDKPEWRWSLSGKYKGKEKQGADVVNVQLKEIAYEEKLRKIRTLAGPTTKAKVAALKDHLSHRYKRLEDHLNAHQEPLNLAEISRWWAGQNTITRTAMTKAEPFTWLKEAPAAVRSRWFLTSLIIREYFASQVFREDPMVTIHEDSSLSLPTPLQADYGPTGPFQMPRGAPYMRRPSVDTGYTSLDPPSESAGAHEYEHSNRHSDGSVYSGIHGVRAGGIPSPASSRQYLREVFALRRRQNDSDDALSSARNSLSERSEDGVTKLSRETKFTSPVASLETKPKTEAGPSVLSRNSPEANRLQPIPSAPSLQIPLSKLHISASASPISLSPAAVQHRHSHRSPLLSDTPPEPTEQELLRRAAEEERTKEEYELKSVLLEQFIAQNQRIRHILNRVATGIREYEAAQSSFGAGVGSDSKSHVPLDVLESLGHDPANVTGATRKLEGWRAVEDIHMRLTRQRETLENYLASAPPTSPFQSSVLDDPLQLLVQSLNILAIKKEEVAEKALQASEKLDEARTIHSAVKQEYNNTLTHVSVVYPELSQIIALEESYKDQYQHFWDIGMDALTFLLDTVTPFWRTYGKTIGDDVRDFLIVPLYRNEFTGEAKRYPIKHLPSRSFRHYVGLVVFFMSSVCICTLQCRAAVTSAIHYRLMWIEHTGVRWLLLPFFWVGILIQWTATLIEFCIVLMQLGMVLWWLAWLMRLTV